MLNKFVFFFDLSLLLPYFEKLNLFRLKFFNLFHIFLYFLDLLLLELNFLNLHFLFFWPTIFLLFQKNLQLIPFTCTRYLFMSTFCSSISSSVVSFFSSCFLVSIHMCFPFLSFVFSVYDLFLKHVFGNFCTSGLVTFLLIFLRKQKITCLCTFAFLSFFWGKKEVCFL